MSVCKEELIEFEKEIAQIYEQGKIKAPIHLRNGNEDILIALFDNIRHEDYVFSTWGSHLHALLKGVPRELVKSEILAGRSITLMFPEYNLFTSAIVAGICSIGVGVAWALKQKKSNRKVYVFIGDMAGFSGITQESIEYAYNFDLPVEFIIEDNGKSVGTPTKDAWGNTCKKYFEEQYRHNDKVGYYQYKLDYPHASTGKFIYF